MCPKSGWKSSTLCIIRIHLWIQTGVTDRKRSIRVKIVDFSAYVPWKSDGWPRKTIGHLFYGTSRFVHYFVAICEFKLELQSRNAQFGSISSTCRPVWLRNLTDDLEKQIIGHLFPEFRGQRSRSQRSNPNLDVSLPSLQFKFTHGDEMMHRAWCGIGQVPYCSSRSHGTKHRQFLPELGVSGL